MSANTGTADDEGKGNAEGPLTALYRKHVDESAEKQDIWVGFGLFFGGIALGLIAFVMFVYSGLQETGSAVYWQFREIALVAGLLGLPAVVGSVIALLPVGRRTKGVTVVGGVLCVVAIGILSAAYPYDWTTDAGVDGSLLSISVYAAGLIILSASTGSALVAQYLERMSGTETSVSEDTTDEDGETVTTEDVEADIEDALGETELSWGGVEQQQNTKRLSLDMPDVDTDANETAIENAEATERRASGDNVTDAVDGLEQLKGGASNTERAGSTEEQVDALTQFREQQERETVETGVEESSGLLTRLRDRLGL